MKKRTLCTILALTLLIGLLPASGALAAESKTKAPEGKTESLSGGKGAGQAESPRRRAVTGANKFGNQYIEAYVANNGQFTIGTTGGNPNMPNDANKQLLYGHGSPWSGFTTIQINEINYIFKADGAPVFNAGGTEAVSTMTISAQNVTVVQRITLVTNQMTDRPDAFRIRYEAANRSGAAKDIGVRIMMDTCLGSNDYAPFRVPGLGNVDYQLELTGADIPQTYQVFNSFEDPSIVAAGTFYRTASERPDKVQFAYWGGVENTYWDYSFTNGSDLDDSAVAVYFNPKAVGAGQTRTASTYYGLGQIDNYIMKDPLSMYVYAPPVVDIDIESGAYSNPFTITAYIKNTSEEEEDVENVRLRLELPAELALESGDDNDLIVDIPSLSYGEEKQVDFSLVAAEQPTAKNVNYTLYLTADGDEVRTLPMTLHLPVPADVTVSAAANGQASGGGTFSTGKDVTVTATPDTGYAFEGWYVNNRKVSSDAEYTFVLGGDITLQARFVRIAVTFNLNGGRYNNTTTPPARVNYNAGDLIARPAGSLTRTGYNFSGWANRSGSAESLWDFSIDRITAPITLYAKWTPAVYSINYSLNGGTRPPAAASSYTYGRTYSLPAPSRAGYRFEGWFREAALTNKVSSVSNTDTGDKTFHAKWSIITYKIAYKDGNKNAKVPSSARKQYNVGSSAYTLPKATKKGYVFSGWYTDSSLRTKAGASIAQGSTGDKTYYAKFVKRTAVISAKKSSMKTGRTLKLTGKSNAQIKSVSWKLSNANARIKSKKGKNCVITGVTPGKVKVTLTIKYKDKSAKKKVSKTITVK